MIKERLAELAESPGPDTAVDAAAAIAKGRRVRRGRRWTAALAAAGLAAAAAVPLGQAARPDERRAPITAPARYPAPLVLDASFGWLPEGYARTAAARVSGPGIGRSEVSAGRGIGRPGVLLAVFEQGVEPDSPRLPGGRAVPRTPARPINGRPAHWAIEPGGAGSKMTPAELRWEYRPGHWAVLTVNDRPFSGAATVRRIAESVRFGARPVRFPLRVAGVPGGLTVERASVDGTGEAALSLRGPDGGELGISLTPANPAFGAATANASIAGRPAFDSRRPFDPRKTGGIPVPRTYREMPFVWVFGVRGFDVHLTASGKALEALDATGGLAGLFRRITFLGSDESKWTTTPLG